MFGNIARNPLAAVAAAISWPLPYLTLSGIFRKLDVEAGLYLYLDVGDANYADFYKFAKSPSR